MIIYNKLQESIANYDHTLLYVHIYIYILDFTCTSTIYIYIYYRSVYAYHEQTIYLQASNLLLVSPARHGEAPTLKLNGAGAGSKLGKIRPPREMPKWSLGDGTMGSRKDQRWSDGH